jgi:2-dehydropantoate 2-reductase
MAGLVPAIHVFQRSESRMVVIAPASRDGRREELTVLHAISRIGRTWEAAMRFLVLGAGALGGFFGSRLIRAGADVTFLVRPGRAAQLQRDGLVVNGQDGDVFREKVKVVQQGQVDGTYDVVLLTCKAYDLDGAIASIAPAMGEHTAVLPLLNGVRHIDALTAAFRRERVLGGLTVINAALLADGTIQQSQVRVNLNVVGELDGRVSDRCNAIKSSLDAGGIPVQIADNILAMMWGKLHGFAAIATIATLTRARAGTIVKTSSGASFVSAVIEECERIVTAAGYPPAPPPAPDTAAIVRGLYSQPDSTYGPSMLIDMEDGRPTEAEHVIGDLVQRAAQLGLPVPILTAALCNLQAYEIARMRAGPGAMRSR